MTKRDNRVMFRMNDEDRAALERLTAYRYRYGRRPVISDVLRDAVHYHATAIASATAPAIERPTFDAKVEAIRAALG